MERSSKALATFACAFLFIYILVGLTDPVEIIQDCSLCDIVRRAIEIYFERLEPINCSGNKNCNCRNNNFLGIF